MIDFLIRQDIEDSVLIDEDDIALIGKAKEVKFLDQSNEFYLNEALELGVSESDIVVYDPNVDTEDLRDYNCKRVVEYHYLKDVFFALWKKGKTGEDVYYQKYIEASKLFNNMLSKLSYNRIIGLKPAQVKTKNSYSTITRRFGDNSYSGSCVRSDRFDKRCY